LCNFAEYFLIFTYAVKQLYCSFSGQNVLFVCSPITLVVAKCWDPNPKGYLTIPRQEPVRPIDPSAWVSHTEAVRNNLETWGRAGPPSVSTVTSTSSSLISSIPANERTYLVKLKLNLN